MLGSSPWLSNYPSFAGALTDRSIFILFPFLVWHIFLLDRCGSIMTNLPAALPDECDSFSQIETVWPRMLEEYETVRHTYNILNSDHALTWSCAFLFTRDVFSTRIMAQFDSCTSQTRQPAVVVPTQFSRFASRPQPSLSVRAVLVQDIVRQNLPPDLIFLGCAPSKRQR